ncbi:uncharacterized protein LOC113562520 [Ooceraea biroi]|nr:uncharacterized protein LOC113562520 [Ooceraea biroi]
MRREIAAGSNRERIGSVGSVGVAADASGSSSKSTTTMDMRIDWIVKTIREMKDEITGKKEIKSLIMEIIRCECEDIKKELKQVIIEQMGRVKEEIQNWKSEGVNILNETVKTELQKGLCHTSVTNSETGEIKKSYSGAAKNQRESVLIVKPKNGEKNNLSENTKKIDIAKLGVGITKMKKVAGGAVVIGCENKDQAEKLKDEVARDLGDEYEVQAPRRRKMKLKIFDVDKEDCEDEQGFWEKIRDQNELRMNSIERKIIHKVVRANSKRMTVVAVVNAETRERFLQLEKLKIGWNICRVQDYVGILRCFKCCGYYHFAKDCSKLKEICGKCADQHATKDCNSKTRKCINCEEKIRVYNIKNLKTDHSSYDNNCPCLRKEMKKQRDRIQCN